MWCTEPALVGLVHSPSINEDLEHALDYIYGKIRIQPPLVIS